jgi:hypothetical protein
MKIALPLLFSLFAPFAWSAEKDASAPFVLSVVPSWSSQKSRTISMADDKAHEFYVVLTNVSKDPQAVFEYWNSWGFATISFECTTVDGRKIVIAKGEQSFTMNAPSTFLIPLGEPQVYAIRLDTSWVPSSKLPFDADGKLPITLKAIYQVGSTPEATEHKVWTGRIESKPYDLVLWRRSK